MQIALFRIEYAYKKSLDEYKRFKTYIFNILAENQKDAEEYIINKLGAKNVLLKSVDEIPVHQSTPALIESIIVFNLDVYTKIKEVKEFERQKNNEKMSYQIEKAKKEGYDVDAKINNGNEKKKESSIGDSKKY